MCVYVSVCMCECICVYVYMNTLTEGHSLNKSTHNPITMSLPPLDSNTRS